MNKTNALITGIFIIIIVLLSGCPGRKDIPVVAGDSTVVYPAKEDDGVSASITYYHKKSKKTGKMLGVGNEFNVSKKGRLRANIDIGKLYDRKLIFHIDWIGPNGRSLFKKKIEVLPEDSLSAFESSISISSEKRNPGKYSLRVYYFRELIAEKAFELKPEAEKKKVRKKIVSNIQLSKRKYKQGKEIKEDTIFKRGKNKRIHAIIKLQDHNHYQKDLPVKVLWNGPDKKTFYKKTINVSPSDTVSYITSSISCSRKKREPGNYEVKVTLFGKKLTSKKFFVRE